MSGRVRAVRFLGSVWLRRYGTKVGMATAVRFLRLVWLGWHGTRIGMARAVRSPGAARVVGSLWLGWYGPSSLLLLRKPSGSLWFGRCFEFVSVWYLELLRRMGVVL